MCRSRSHIHKPCGCTTAHVYICPSFPIQPPPQTLRATHRRYTTDTAPNPFYTPRHLFLCRKSFYAFPDVQDPAPCRSHRVLERDVRLVKGPPRAPDGTWDEFDEFAFRRRVRDSHHSPGVKTRNGIGSGDRGGWRRGGVYDDNVSAGGSEVGYNINIHQTPTSKNSIPLSMTVRKSTKQIPSRTKKRENTTKQHRHKKQQKRQVPRARHLRIIPKEGYESFPLMDIDMDTGPDTHIGANGDMRERDVEKCGLMSDDEAGCCQKKGILSRVWSLGMIGRRGSSVV